MNKKISKYISVCFLTVCLMIVQLMPTFAADINDFDTTRLGSLSITCNTTNNVPVQGVDITIYRVADGKVNSNGKYTYTFTKSYENSKLSLEQPYNAQSANAFAKYTKDKSINGTTIKTNSSGKVKFENLQPGLYLIMQTSTINGFSAASPFLSCFPTTHNEKWIYDIDASPKMEFVQVSDITVNKVWNDNQKNRPTSVTIQLFHGGTLYDSVVLSKSNNWKHTWTNLVKDGTWSVKEINVPNGYTDTYKDNGMSFTVTNTSTLIQTGQLNWPIPILSSVGLLFILAGWWLVNLQRKSK